MDDDGEGGRDTGPKGELEYWRNRMQRLTSITEQLKRKVCKRTVAKTRRKRDTTAGVISRMRFVVVGTGSMSHPIESRRDAGVGEGRLATNGVAVSLAIVVDLYRT